MGTLNLQVMEFGSKGVEFGGKVVGKESASNGI